MNLADSANVQPDRNLANVNSSLHVFIQTIRLKLYNGLDQIIVSTVTYFGSQRYYNTKATTAKIIVYT